MRSLPDAGNLIRDREHATRQRRARVGLGKEGGGARADKAEARLK